MNGYYNDNGRRQNGYNDRRYNEGGYRDGGAINCPYQINQTVRHIATGIKLVVIKVGREQVECRKPDLGADWFYLYELEPLGPND